MRGTRWHSWLRHYATSRNVMGSTPYVSLEFFINVILPASIWLWDRLSIWQKWVLAKFPGELRRVVRRAENRITFMCRLKSGSLNLLETSSPFQDCIGFIYFTLICLLWFTKCFVMFILFILRLFSCKLNISIVIIIIIIILLLYLESKLFKFSVVLCLLCNCALYVCYRVLINLCSIRNWPCFAKPRR